MYSWGAIASNLTLADNGHPPLRFKVRSAASSRWILDKGEKRRSELTIGRFWLTFSFLPSLLFDGRWSEGKHWESWMI
jgi:hypothetical protein